MSAVYATVFGWLLSWMSLGPAIRALSTIASVITSRIGGTTRDMRGSLVDGARRFHAGEARLALPDRHPEVLRRISGYRCISTPRSLGVPRDGIRLGATPRARNHEILQHARHNGD